MLAVEPAEQGYNASYIYCDEETMYIARDQMKLLEGRLPQKEDEVVVSRYFLSNYGADAGIGEKVMLPHHGLYGTQHIAQMDLTQHCQSTTNNFQGLLL